jgi:phage terminase Nu1 subunit (DNA packaging protein)
MAVTLTVEQLAELVRQQVAAELAKLPTTGVKEVLTLAEVCELLDRSDRAVKQLVEQGMPVNYISAREPRFLRSKVLAWIETLPTKPAAERAA